jgi:GNAT superfamily N-acetyltransferase
MTLREIEVGDGRSDEVVALLQQLFTPETLEPEALLRAELTGQRELPVRYLVAEEDDCLLGVLRYAELLPGVSIAIHLAVDPDRQSGGVGTALMRKLLSITPSVLLEVGDGEERLDRFYGRLGARVIAPDYTQPALQEHLPSVPLRLMAISLPTEQIRPAIWALYRNFWGMPLDHPFVKRALETAI